MTKRGRETRNFGWGLIDQGLSSATNFGGSVLAARALTASEFGAFAVGFAVYLIALGISRAWSSEPLQIRFSAARGAQQQGAIRSSAGASLAIGVGVGLISGAAGLVIGGQVRGVLLALALLLPGLMLQDLWRFALVMTGRSRAAAINDAIWMTTMVGLFAILESSLSAWAGIAVWAAGASVAAAAGSIQISAFPSLSIRTWWSSHAQLGWPYSGEFLLTTGVTYALTFGVAARQGLTETAGFRGAHVLMGPLNVIFFGAGMQLVPTMVRRAGRSLHSMSRTVVATSTTLVAVSLSWVLMIIFIPTRVGEMLMGDSWKETSDLVIVVAAGTVASAATSGPRLGLKALGDARRAFRVRLLLSPIVLLLGGGGAIISGAIGAAFGLSAAGVISIPIWWQQYHRSVLQISHLPDAGDRT